MRSTRGIEGASCVDARSEAWPRCVRDLVFLEALSSGQIVCVQSGQTAKKTRYIFLVRGKNCPWAQYGVASDGSKGGNSLDAVTPGLTLGTLYSSGVEGRGRVQSPSEF